MIFNRSCLLTLFLFLLSATCFAQFVISGEIRPRAEYRHGFRSLAINDQNTAFFIDQRTRLNLDYSADNYQFKLVIQDVRTWGSTSQLVSTDGVLTTLHEAWAQLKVSESFAVKFGRQEVILDDQRIFGNVGWLQQARSHDAAIVKLKTESLKADLGLAYNQSGPQSTTTFYTIPNSYKTFQYLWLNRESGKLNGSILFLNNGRQGGDASNFKTYFSQTIGGRLGYSNDPIVAHAVAYYQGGREAGFSAKIEASLLGLDLAYKINGKSTALIGVEILSGNDEVNPNSKNNSFNPFYGTNHKFNGFMDYFYVGNHIFSVGLQDVFFQFKSAVGKVNTNFNLHVFLSEEDVLDVANSVAADRYLGTELDLVFDYNIAPQVNFKVGYSQMFGSDTMEILRGGDKDATSNWAWTMITVSPQFFTTKNESN